VPLATGVANPRCVEAIVDIERRRRGQQEPAAVAVAFQDGELPVAEAQKIEVAIRV